MHICSEANNLCQSRAISDSASEGRGERLSIEFYTNALCLGYQQCNDFSLINYDVSFVEESNL